MRFSSTPFASAPRSSGRVVGIPRSLLFYKYGLLWRTFLETLECRVVVSPPTNRHIVEAGILKAVDETCLPVKIFLGHVSSLGEQVNTILIPRIVSLRKNEEACTKFLALGEIVRNTFEDLDVLEYSVDVWGGKGEADAFVDLGRQLGWPKGKSRAAYINALRTQAEHDHRLLETQMERLSHPDTLKILIVSHPYTIRDAFYGKPIVDFLASSGASVIYSDVMEPEQARRLSLGISKDLYWTYNKEFLGAIELYKERVDGIIYVMSFPCGPDALVVELCQRKVRTCPSMVLTLDEQQGEAGLITRLESFLDILERRRTRAV